MTPFLPRKHTTSTELIAYPSSFLLPDPPTTSAIRFSTTLTSLATLLTLSNAFVIDVFDLTDCSGASREVNVWDNTYAT
jgi:hypothetical protein